ncbi:hypothetical protein LOTGIDRAFT_235549 [Lottia gigantea]|uniref:Uncharacterized protein n=1 Tax=Lottia gigantea TaxID=225164 RepID=V3ZUD5_LOTGI|nr:hypothetical protein LOTGIDRAFT_235549 [Lottia gigantea]ESO86195.1 hypothetical protein LOTGIDRAFT_235549 [Lottia gigantea]
MVNINSRLFPVNQKKLQMAWMLFHVVCLIFFGEVSSVYFECRRIGTTCRNGGVCVETKPECACGTRDVFVGHDCSLKVDDVALPQELCDPLCKNGGVCRSIPGGFFNCYCNAAFFGKDCSQKRGTVKCAGDRMTVEMTPFPPFDGRVFVRGKENDPNCRFTRVYGTYSATFLFNGPCSVEKMRDTPTPGDETYKVEITVLHSQTIQTKYDMLFTGLCVHSGTGSNNIGDQTSNIGDKPGGPDETTSSNYQPVVFELQTVSGSNIVPPVFIGTELRLYFALYDTGKYKKIYIADCVALNGLTGRDLRSLTMVKDGCPTDEGRSVVMGQLVYDLITPSVVVNFKVFKFVNSDTLSFQCNIRVCTASETDCNPPQFCRPSKNSIRGKRHIHLHSREFTLSSNNFFVKEPLNRTHTQRIVKIDSGSDSDSDIVLADPESCLETKGMMTTVIVLAIVVDYNMLLLGLSFLITIYSVVSQRCPYGWFHRPGSQSCYLITHDDVPYTWNDAQNRCTSFQGALVKINTQDEKDWLISQLNKIQQLFNSSKTATKVTEWWIGLTNRQDSNDFVWTDGTQMNTSLITFNTESETDKQVCVRIQNLDFNAVKCTLWRHFICERSKDIPLKCEIDEGWTSLNDKCYKVFDYKRTYKRADVKCQLSDATLATIPDDSTQTFIWGLVKKYGANIWIGLSTVMQGEQYKWQWINGTDLIADKAYWKDGSPTQASLQQSNGSCVQMLTGPTIKRKLSWQTNDCYDSMGFVCQKPQGVCEPGWLIHQSNCYQINTRPILSWDRANAYCTAQRGTLLKINSAADQLYVNDNILSTLKPGSGGLWFGAVDDGKNGPFKWSDGMDIPKANKNWANAYPTNIVDKRDCGYIDNNDVNGKWQTSTDCSQPRAFVCQIPVNQRVRKVTIPPETFTCTDGWSVFGQYCYMFNDTDISWPNARAACQSVGADLIRIDNVDLQSFITDEVRKNRGNYWIGLHDRPAEGKYVWLDEKTEDVFNNWAPGQPNNVGGNENCIYVAGTRGNEKMGKWYDYRCNMKLNFICQKPSDNSGFTTPTPTMASLFNPKCGLFWEDNPHSPYCYQFQEELLSWYDASDTCKNRGGKLASITSIQEQYYISGRIKGMRAMSMWLGASDTSLKGGWKWNDGSPFAFLNWDAGEPNNKRSKENCASMFVYTARWVDYDCNRRSGYICKKMGSVARATTTLTPTEPTNIPDGKYYGCSPGYKEYRQSCYLTVRDAKTWLESRDYCRRNGGDLVSIADLEENNFIFSQSPAYSCENVHLNDTECESWAKRGECKKNPIWMSKNCRRDCNMCNKKCEDKHRYCAYWAKTNECTKNPSYMLINCTQSCQVCDGGESDALWIGLNDRTSTMITRKFMWTDGSPITYTNWDNGEPNNYQGKRENCVKMYTNKAISPGVWSDDDCDTPLNGFICKTKKSIQDAVTTNPLSSGCPDGQIGYHSKCYNFVSTPLTWQNAEKKCVMSSGNERSTCVGMNTSHPIGLWTNANCSQSKPYICESLREGFTTPEVTTVPTTAFHISCPTGWSEYLDNCYKSFTNRKTWLDARQYCLNIGGDLASIHNATAQDVIKLTFNRFQYRSSYWIGLNDKATEGKHEWTDGTPVEFTSWGKDEPNDVSGREDCVEVSQYGMKWNDNNCYLLKNFICMIERGQNISLTTPQPVSTEAPVACADKDWVYFNGSCYYTSPAYGRDSSKSWYDADRFCQDKGGHLTSILSEEEDNFLLARLAARSTAGVTVWIGLNDLDGSYKWTDGSLVQYKSWGRGEPNDAYGGQRCINFYSLSGDWNDDNCMDSFGFICKKLNLSSSVAPTTPEPIIDGGCPTNFRAPDYSNKCFYVGGLTTSGAQQWEVARNMCRSLGHGSDLATIGNSNEQAFVVTLLRNTVKTGMWIGLFDKHINGKYTWSDNSELTYTNWGPGEPSDHWSYSRFNREDCVEIHLEDGRVGTWNDQKCLDKRPYLCQSKRDTRIPKVPPTSTIVCPSGYISYGTSCYKLVNQPKTWQDAQKLCRSDGATSNLASTFSMYEQAFMEVLTYSLKSPYWIGLSDQKEKGVYNWVDGWPTSFSYWGDNEPSKADGEGCVAVMNGKWNDTLCNSSYPFICMINTAPPPPTTPMPTGRCADPTWTMFGDFCYFADFLNSRSWPEARYICQSRGAELLSIHNKEELSFVKQLAHSQTFTTRRSLFYRTSSVANKIWIGLYKVANGGFQWSDKSPALFLNWATGEPSDTDAKLHENCVELYRDSGVWNDVDCFGNKAYICKAKKIVMTTTTTTTPTPPTTTTAKSTATGDLVTVDNNQRNLPTSLPVRRNPIGTSSGLSGGEIAGIVIGVVGCAIIVVVFLIIVKRQRSAKSIPSMESVGFDNALYSKSASDIDTDNSEIQSQSGVIKIGQIN